MVSPSSPSLVKPPRSRLTTKSIRNPISHFPVGGAEAARGDGEGAERDALPTEKQARTKDRTRRDRSVARNHHSTYPSTRKIILGSSSNSLEVPSTSAQVRMGLEEVVEVLRGAKGRTRRRTGRQKSGGILGRRFGVVGEELGGVEGRLDVGLGLEDRRNGIAEEVIGMEVGRADLDRSNTERIAMTAQARSTDNQADSIASIRTDERRNVPPTYNFLSPSSIFPLTPPPSTLDRTSLPLLLTSHTRKRDPTTPRTGDSTKASIVDGARTTAQEEGMVELGLGVERGRGEKYYYPQHLPLDYDHSLPLDFSAFSLYSFPHTSTQDRLSLTVSQDQPKEEKEVKGEEETRPSHPFFQKELILPRQLSLRRSFSSNPPPFVNPFFPSRSISTSSKSNLATPPSPDLLPAPFPRLRGGESVEERERGERIPPTPRQISPSQFRSSNSNRATAKSLGMDPSSTSSLLVADATTQATTNFTHATTQSTTNGIGTTETGDPMVGLGFSGVALAGIDVEREEVEWTGARIGREERVDGRVWPILKVENIPFGITLEEIENWLPNYCLPSPVDNVLSIHIILHRMTGKTLPHLYVQCATIESGKLIMKLRDGAGLVGRRVRIKWAKKGELIRDLFDQNLFLRFPTDSTMNPPPPTTTTTMERGRYASSPNLRAFNLSLPSPKISKGIPFLLLHPPTREVRRRSGEVDVDSERRKMAGGDDGNLEMGDIENTNARGASQRDGRAEDGGLSRGGGLLDQVEMRGLVKIANSGLIKSFSPIERPFHHLISLITHLPSLSPLSPPLHSPSPSNLVNSFEKLPTISSFPLPRSRPSAESDATSLGLPQQPPPTPFPSSFNSPKFTSSSKPVDDTYTIAGGRKEDWKILWETAYDLTRIAGMKFLELDPAFTPGIGAARGTRVGGGDPELGGIEGRGDVDVEGEAERRVYWRCCAMLANTILSSPFSDSQKRSTIELMDSFSFPSIDQTLVSLPLGDSSRKFEDQLDTPPPTPLPSKSLSTSPTLPIADSATLDRPAFLRSISNQYRSQSTGRPLAPTRSEQTWREERAREIGRRRVSI